MFQDVTTTFESFYTGTSPRLLRYAYGLTGDMAEAQDLTQEAYARAWSRWKRLRGYDNPESWLRLVVSRLAVDRLRWLGVRRSKPSREEAVVPPPDDEMMTLVAALKQLPMTQRKALVLHYFLDMPVAEIAEETGANVNTVKTWLARGRVNVAAELGEVTADLQGVRDKARRRRHRTVTTSITAFLATAAATAAAFLFVPEALPPVLRPDLVLRYPGQPALTGTMLVGRRALTLWIGTKGESRLGAIDLPRGTQPWRPIDLGRFDDSLVPLGVHEGVMVFMGTSNDASRTEVFGVDVNTGRIAWRPPPEGLGVPVFDRRAGTIDGGRPGAGILIVLDPRGARGLDWRTGRPVWTIPSAPSAYSLPDGDRFAQVDYGGVLRLRELSTGRVLSERSGVPPVEQHDITLLDGRLYLPNSQGMWRMPVTGSEPASQLLAGREGGNARRCGNQVCLEGDGFVAAFDGQTGKPVWRQETRSRNLSVSEFGTIVTIATTEATDAWGSVPGEHQVIVDAGGSDITPESLGTRQAFWIDGQNLLLRRRVDRGVIPGGSGPLPARSFELSLYSVVTKRERSLGKHDLYGGCVGARDRFVCAGKDGFIMVKP